MIVSRSFEAVTALPEDTYLAIVGTGKLEEKLRATAVSLGIADRVRWVGFAPMRLVAGRCRWVRAMSRSRRCDLAVFHFLGAAQVEDPKSIKINRGSGAMPVFWIQETLPGVRLVTAAVIWATADGGDRTALTARAPEHAVFANDRSQGLCWDLEDVGRNIDPAATGATE